LESSVVISLLLLSSSADAVVVGSKKASSSSSSPPPPRWGQCFWSRSSSRRIIEVCNETIRPGANAGRRHVCHHRRRVTHARAHTRKRKRKRKEKRVLFLLLLSFSLSLLEEKSAAKESQQRALFERERERGRPLPRTQNIFPFFHINPKHFEALFRVLNFQKKKREKKREEREKERGNVFVHMIPREETLRLKGTPYAHTLHKAFCGPLSLSLSLSLSLLFERRLLFERLCVFVVVERTRERELSAYFYPSKSLSVF